MKNNINKYLKKCLIYPYNFLKFINVKYLMNNNKIVSLIIKFILCIIIVYKYLLKKEILKIIFKK